MQSVVSVFFSYPNAGRSLGQLAVKMCASIDFCMSI